MDNDIRRYIESQTEEYREVCERLQAEITAELTGSENKVWHAHPVWFLSGNPTVGYSKLKGGIRLMFWSGADFNEPDLVPGTGKFKDASITYQSVEQINSKDLRRWLKKSKQIQWDYKNLIKNKGRLNKLSS